MGAREGLKSSRFWHREPWGRLGRAGGAPAVLEAYKMHLGRSLGRLGAVLGALEAMLEPSGGPKAPKMEPKRAPDRAPEATRAENCETVIFDDSTKDFDDLSCLRAHLCVKNLLKLGPESHHRRRRR